MNSEADPITGLLEPTITKRAAELLTHSGSSHSTSKTPMETIETVVVIDVAHAKTLAAMLPTAEYERIIEEYRSVADRIKNYSGTVWRMEGTGVVSVFDQPERAVFAITSLLHELNDLNTSSAISELPFRVRIGISLNHEGSLLKIPEDARDKATPKALTEAERIERSCPVGRIAITEDVYSRISTIQGLFRPTPSAAYFVLEQRPLVPQEEPLANQLLAKQKKALPAPCFLGWNIVRPDAGASLKGLRSVLQKNVAVILGDTSSKSRGILHSASTSDTVGLTEALSLMKVDGLSVGIDEWQDTADLVADNHVVLVGSGATNMYSLVLNDVFRPMRFYRTTERSGFQHGRSLDTIVATAADGTETFYGRHAEANEDAGLMIMAKSAFNLDRTMLFVAGITGMGTQAVFNLLKDIAVGRARLHDQAIGCIISPRVPESNRDGSDISEYYRKWRISDYEILHQIDHDGNKL